MSINDLMNDESFIPMFMIFLVLIMLIAVPIGISITRKANKDIYGGNEEGEPVSKQVKIISRRSTPHPYNQSVLVNMVVFETERGERIELAIKDSTMYNVMLEGDKGTLRYIGKQFINFTRKV